MKLFEQQELVIYNSISKTKEKFKPINDGSIGMYVCGPTVYSNVHLGNCRTFLSFDLIFRYLKHLGFKVRYVRNITDAGHLENDADSGEDRIAKKARIEMVEPMEIVQRYTVDFHQTMSLFNALPPSIEPTATGHIIEQIEIIEKIILEGFAYIVNGSVYFDVHKFNETNSYGKLSGRNLEDMVANTRDLAAQSDKKNPQDFALWKKAEPEHIMRWPSPWSQGFPGWHLECTAMSTKYLGKQFDIHGGGMDLKFPHHENEIAQSKCSTGKDLASYWMHTGSLRIDQDKMSKSLDNFVTIKDALKIYPSEVVRFFLLSSHYRSPMNYSIDGLVEAQASLDRLYTALKGCELRFDTEENEFSVQYREIMEDDFNVPGALAVFFDMAKSINLYKESKKTDQANKLASSLISLAEPLGILQQDPELYLKAGVPLSEDKIDALIKERELARTNKDFKRSDQIRDELVNMNIVLEDSVEGTSWRRK